VKSIWEELDVSSSSTFIVVKNCIFLSQQLKLWNRDVFGHLDTQLAYLADKVHNLGDKEQHHSLTFVERVERLEIKKELSKVRSWIDIFRR